MIDGSCITTSLSFFLLNKREYILSNILIKFEDNILHQTSSSNVTPVDGHSVRPKRVWIVKIF